MTQRLLLVAEPKKGLIYAMHSNGPHLKLYIFLIYLVTFYFTLYLNLSVVIVAKVPLHIAP